MPFMPSARLLVVEDNEEIAQMITLFLAARGFKVSVAQDAASALQLVREALPDLILLDIGLPDINGYELLKQLRQNPRTRHLPAIFVSQRRLRPDRLAGLELGADDFVTKPFDPDELGLRVQNLVAHAARENLINPLTSLPDQKITLEEIARAQTQPERAVIEFRLRHAEEFCDLYGTLAYADLLRHIALMVNRVLNDLGAAADFLGQKEDKIFVVITARKKAAALRQAVVERFDREVLQHYSLAERVGDLVKVKDPAGQEHLVPPVRFETTLSP
jgi:DNA-binding response OmpR family regulator